MKTLFTFLIVLVSLAFSANASAQVDRSITGQYSKSKKKAEKVDYVELSLTKLTEELTLDNFQQAVIKNILKDVQKEYEKTFALDIPTATKNEKIEILKLRLSEELKTVLNPEQIKKYESLEKGKKK